MGKTENQQIEIELLLEAIYRKYGYDFRSYSKASIKRRILRRLSLSAFSNVSELQYHILYDPKVFQQLLLDFSINVTEMFRDPVFYKAIRQQIVPVLKTYPYLKIWHAGCSTGEEVYSMAIILKEEGLYEKIQIYATDFNEKVLEEAKEAIYDVDKIKEYTLNYQKAGGKESFADYYTAKYDLVAVDPSLKKNIVFANHNLVADGVFGEMNVVICRNVLIYFNRELQNHVIKLFYDSLCHYGFLCLGLKESLRFSTWSSEFEIVADNEKIYRKKL